MPDAAVILDGLIESVKSFMAELEAKREEVRRADAALAELIAETEDLRSARNQFDLATRKLRGKAA